MNNTEKLIASQYLFKQANLGALLSGAKNIGKNIFRGAVNPIHSAGELGHMAVPKYLGGKYDKFDKDVFTQGLGGLGLLGGVASIGYGPGRYSGMQQGLDVGRRQGAAEGRLRLLLQQNKNKNERGYLGNLFDALMNR